MKMPSLAMLAVVRFIRIILSCVIFTMGMLALAPWCMATMPVDQSHGRHEFSLKTDCSCCDCASVSTCCFSAQETHPSPILIVSTSSPHPLVEPVFYSLEMAWQLRPAVLAHRAVVDRVTHTNDPPIFLRTQHILI